MIHNTVIITFVFLKVFVHFKLNAVLSQGSADFSCKGSDVLGFAGHTVPVRTTQLCYCSTKTFRDSMSEMNESDWILTKFYLWTLKFEFHYLKI